MIAEWIETNEVLFDVLWQSTFWLALGLLGRVLLEARPARRHGALLLCILAALVSPALTACFDKLGWGWWGPGMAAAAADGTAPHGAGARPVAFGIWHSSTTAFFALAGAMALVLLFRLGRSFVNGARMVSRAAPIEDKSIKRAARVASSRLGMRQPPLLLRSETVPCPVIWCWGRRPRILLPDAMVARHGSEYVSVLSHELAHWKRRDHLSSLLVELATCLLAWHPLMWVARRHFNAAHEEACDAWVLWTGTRPDRYAAVLLALRPQESSTIALAAIHDHCGLRRRIERILAESPPAPDSGRRFVLAALGVAAILIASTALAQRRAPDTTRAESFATLPASSVAHSSDAYNDIEIRPAELDLGTAPKGSVKTGRVWLVNRSARPVTLAGAKASCGCTTVQDVRGLVLPPDRSLPVEISMDASGAAPGERKTKHVTFQFEGRGPIKIPVHVTIEAAAH